MSDRLNLNGVDLSGYMSNLDLSHDGDDKSAWHDKIEGLQQSRLTVTGTWESDVPTVASLFASRPSERDITVQVTDGRWQAIKARLARRWPLRWLKVRWRVYTTRGVPRLNPETGTITVSATAPLTVAIITRRGRP